MESYEELLVRAGHNDVAVMRVDSDVKAGKMTRKEGKEFLIGYAQGKRNARPATGTPTPYPTHRDYRREDNSTALIRMHTDAMAVQAGVSTPDECGPDFDMIDNPRPLTAAREFLVANGAAPSDNPRNTIKRAIEMSLEMQQRNSGVDDYTSIYGNLLNRTVAKAWDNSDESHRQIVGNVVVPDYKQYTAILNPEFPALEKVHEGGEIKRFSLGSDSKETGQLANYGAIHGLSIDAQVNGDISPLIVSVREAIRSADRTRGDAVYQVFTANSMTGPAMSDGNNLFDATNHSNWVASGSGAAPSTTTLQALRALMQKQVGVSGASGSVLNIRARYLIVPVALQSTAETLVAAMDQEANRRLIVVADARLDGSSETAWYLAADPELHSTIDLATLTGANQRPQLENRTRWATGGLEFRVLDSFHVMPVDWRSLAGNFGA